MSYIESKGKHDTLRIPFKDGDRRDYERALAKLIKSWWDVGYFYKTDVDSIYVSEKDKELLALSDKEVEALPEVFKKPAQEARQHRERNIREYEKMSKDYDIVEVLVSASTPEEGLKAVEKKFGLVDNGRRKDHYVHYITGFYGDAEYQMWEVINEKDNNNTDTWN